MSEQKIINADCLEVMKTFPDKSFDLVLTDPPYGIQVDQHQTGGRGDRPTGFSWDSVAPSVDMFSEICRVSKEQIIWGANYFNCFSGNHGAIVWDKLQPLPDASQYEIASYSRLRKVFKYEQRWTNFVNTKVSSHPTEKPVELMKWLISNFTKESDTILDPFMGSGTTLVAAKLLNRNATGIEISPEYCRIAEDRLRQGVLL